MLTAASIQIDLGEFQEALTLPEIAASPEEQHHRKREVRLEEVLGGTQVVGEWWSNSDEELGSQSDEDEDDSKPGTPNSADGLEGNFIESATLSGPCLSEANVCLARWLERLWNRSSCSVLTMQIDPHVKRAARPDSARSQSKTVLPFEAKTT